VSRGDLVLVSDADLSAPIGELGKLEARSSAALPVAIGSRAKRGAREVDQPCSGGAMGKGFNLLVQAIALRGSGYAMRFQSSFAVRWLGSCSRSSVRTLRLRCRSAVLGPQLRVRGQRGASRWINSPETRVQAVRHSREMLRDLIRIRWDGEQKNLDRPGVCRRTTTGEPGAGGLRRPPAGFDVMVVDDSSPDGTGELAAKLAAADPGVDVSSDPGSWVWLAYVTGFSPAPTTGADHRTAPTRAAAPLHERRAGASGRWEPSGDRLR